MTIFTGPLGLETLNRIFQGPSLPLVYACSDASPKKNVAVSDSSVCGRPIWLEPQIMSSDYAGSGSRELFT